MLGTGKAFDLRSLPFSGRDAKTALFEDDESRQLYLAIARSVFPRNERPKLVRFTPVIDNKDVLTWQYEATPGKLTIKTVKGTLEFCYDGPKLLRIRGKGIALRFYFSGMEDYENASAKEDGSLEVAYRILGKLLFVPLKGSLRHDAMWTPHIVKTRDFTLELLPSAETGEFEAVMHEYYSNGMRDQAYKPFDECVAQTEKAFDAFASKLQLPSGQYADLARTAAFALWASHMPAEARMAAPAMFSSKLDLVRAVGWQQAIAAMALKNDPDGAYELLMSPFSKQDEQGQIPNNISDIGEDYVTAGAPMQGFVLCGLLDQDFELSAARWAALYQALAKNTAWWLKARCRTGVPLYYHPEECGWLDATTFLWGVPLQSPDLYTWLIFMTEACGRLAQKLGQAKEAAEWAARSRELLDGLVEQLWRDGQFICRNAKSGKEFVAGSVLRLLPILLGPRLPREITDALAAELADEKTFLTPGGVVSERLRSKEFALKDTALRGGVLPAIQWMLATGLQNAGYAEQAQDIVRRTFKLAGRNGLSDAIPPFGYDPGTGRSLRVEDEYKHRYLEKDRDVLLSERHEPETAFRWTSCGAAGLLALARLMK